MTKFDHFSEVGEHAILLLFTILWNDFGPPKSTNFEIKSTIRSDCDWCHDFLDFLSFLRCRFGPLFDTFSTTEIGTLFYKPVLIRNGKRDYVLGKV